MRLATASSRRRTGIAAATLVGLGLAVVPASAGGGGTPYTHDCPRPESLVRGTTWHTHKVAPGVNLKEGRRSDGRTGVVSMHVLTVDLTTRRLSTAPLMRRLAMRSNLSDLAGGHKNLVAATNTGYFDFRYGTPGGPLVVKNKPLLAWVTPHDVAGFDSAGRLHFGGVSVAGTVTSAGRSSRVAALNVLYPPSGLSVYTPAWGSERVPLQRDAAVRVVTGGAVANQNSASVPGGGYLLVGRGSAATTFVRGLRPGDPVNITLTAASTTATPLTQAYGVGQELVQPGGVARTDLQCRKSYKQPARTAIGVADNGRTMLLVTVEDNPLYYQSGPAVRGLDANQMARVMADLGARQAYLFDGSGSTEMLARTTARGTDPTCQQDNFSGLSCRTFPADGQQRGMPVGLGIFSR